MKRQIKKRFQKEATDKAKLFYLYGIINGLYPKIQIHNLARYLKVIKPVALQYRINNPYIFSDKYITHLTNDEDETVVSFFGYVRGGAFNKNRYVYINGLGDYKIESVKTVNDPCPYETVEVKGVIKRTLKQKENTIFAPWCKLNNIEFDKSDGFITIPEKYVNFTKRDIEEDEVGEGVKIMREMHAKEESDDEEEEVEKESDDEIELYKGINVKEIKSKKKDLKPHQQLNKILNSFSKINQKNIIYQETDAEKLEKEIYSNLEVIKETKHQVDDFLKVSVKHNSNKVKNSPISLDITKNNRKPNFSLEFLIKKSRKYFVTSNYEEEKNDKINLKEIEDEVSSINENKEKEDNNENDENQTKIEINQQAEIEKLEKETKDYLTEDYGYYKLGHFVRIDVKLKTEHIRKFNSSSIIVLANVDIQEQALTYMKIKLEKHLYYPKVIKSNDPIIYSIGWRRFQTTASLCVEDKHQRLRSVKYTPKYTYCFAISYGPIMPIYLRVVAFVSVNPKLPHFRICATGDLIENNSSFQVMKKLKLQGEPYKIEKKTAFIKGMFNSSMEVAKYIGAQIKTVSGIRGQIRKQENTNSHTLAKLKTDSNNDLTIIEGGCFRATFEDRILFSDIVYLVTWFPIPIFPFYNPLLDYANIKLLKTTTEIRNERGELLELNKDSEYKEIKRPDRVFPKLMISKNLEKNLPFKSKSKTKTLKEKTETEQNFLKKYDLPYKKPLKSYLTGSEKDVYSLVQRLQTINNLKEKKTKEVKAEYDKDQKKKSDEILKKQKTRERERRLKANKKSRKNKEN